MKIGTTELLLILAVVIIIFGPTQIPKLTKMFGKGVKNFKEGLEGEAEEDGKKGQQAGAESDVND
ncbi:MAG: twin-arginine translocase TatA/TatE family subunit [Lachnospiraceae bacterium]|nr:twin-arginine translocase TatA/TatE family subunit [Lachnospiraceae bacterium]